MSNDLTLHITDRGEGPVFERFFEAYDRAFILPDEKESREGLARCLDLNHGAVRADLVGRYGDFREVCVIATDGPDGRFIGGANLIAIPLPQTSDGAHVVTANLNYIFTDSAVRGQGYLRRLIAALTQLLSTQFPGNGRKGKVLIFVEQNDPCQMTPEAYARDTAFTGMDQIDRLRIWTRQGARVLDFPYTQPPLSDDQEAEHSLIYSVIGASGHSLPSALLSYHLRSFFGISVLKGQPLSQNPAACAQLDLLTAAGDSIDLLEPAAALDAIQGDPALFIANAGTGSFRDWIRHCQSGRSIVS